MKTENTRVVTDRAILGESQLASPVQLVGVSNFGKNMYNNLSTQRKSLTSLVAEKFMQGVLSNGFPLPCFVAEPISAGTTLQRKESESTLSLRRVSRKNIR